MQTRYLLSAILAFDIASVLSAPVGNAETNSWQALLSNAAAEPKAPATLPQQIFQYGTATTTTGFCAAKLKGNKDNAPIEGFNTARTILVGDETVTLGEELGTGADGTVFDIPAGFNGKPAVAKEFNIAEKGLVEIETLKEVGQFIASAPQDDAKKTLFAIIEKMEGQKLVGLQNFPPFDRAKEFGICPAFMEQIRERIAEAVVKYASTSKGIVHDDFANNGNVLLSGVDPNGYEIKVNLVDWGKITLKGTRSDADIKDSVIHHLMTDPTPINVFTDNQCKK